MNKKIFLVSLMAIMAAVSSLAATSYGFSLGGTKVTSSNCQNITGSNIKSGTASYDPNKKILTLKNVKIEVSGSSNRCFYNESNDMVVMLEGKNEFIDNGRSAIRVEALTCFRSADGNGSLTVTCKSNNEAILVDGGAYLVFDSMKLTVDAQKNYAFGGYKNEYLSFTNAIVDAYGAKGVISDIKSMAVAPSSYLTFTTGADVAITTSLAGCTLKSGVYISSPENVIYNSSFSSFVTNGNGYTTVKGKLIISPIISKVEINATNFPDANFRKSLTSLPAGQDGVLTYNELNVMTELYLYRCDISDLTGIRYFTELTRLTATGNNLTQLNLSNNKKLYSVQIDDNNINGDLMGTLVYSLPDMKNGYEGTLLVYSLNTRDDVRRPDQNFITPAQVTMANNKGWKVNYQFRTALGNLPLPITGMIAYPIQVGYQKVNNLNAPFIPVASGSASYDVETNTLNLKNVEIYANNPLICDTMNLKINFEGNNYLCSTRNRYIINLEESLGVKITGAGTGAKLKLESEQGKGGVMGLHTHVPFNVYTSIENCDIETKHLPIGFASEEDNVGLAIKNCSIKMPEGTFRTYPSLNLYNCHIVKPLGGVVYGGEIRLRGSDERYEGEIEIARGELKFEVGDVNGDGTVNGTDVTALYNALLNNEEPAGNGDVNGDGNINGTDVTALYNLLLNK